MYLWIAYDEEMARASSQTCASSSSTNSFGRVIESFRLVVTPTGAPPANGSHYRRWNQLDSPIAGTSTPAPPPAGELVLPYDGSVPIRNSYLRLLALLARSDRPACNGIPTPRSFWGSIRLPPPPVRLYGGNVTATVYAPAGTIAYCRPRCTLPSPLCNHRHQLWGASAPR